MLRFGDPSISPPMETVVLSLLMGFVLGQIIGWVYMATHTTPSYSSSFVASLVVLPVIVSLMMILMAGSLFIAFGLLGRVRGGAIPQRAQGHARHDVTCCGRLWKGWQWARFATRRRWLGPAAWCWCCCTCG